MAAPNISPATAYQAMHDKLLDSKALQLLYDFHALQYPELHQEQVPVPFDLDTLIDPDDKRITDPSLNLMQKASILQEPFMPVAAELLRPARVRVRTLRKAMVRYCQLQITPIDSETLRGEHGPLLADEILPPQDILAAMHDAWNWRQINRCHPLERYIQEVEASRPRS